MYVCKTCNGGPQLNPRKMSHLPAQFGPSAVHKVLREAVQSCVDCANHERTVFNTIKDGAGKVVITGSYRLQCFSDKKAGLLVSL